MAPLKEVNRGNARFCSQSCSSSRPHISARNRVSVTCSYCGEMFEKTKSKAKMSKHGHFFCSRSHKDMAHRKESGLNLFPKPSHFIDGSSSYRSQALRHSSECSRCGYKDNVKMLDVDHIDCNRKNNEIDNLQVLCVWCHALKTRKVEESVLDP